MTRRHGSVLGCIGMLLLVGCTSTKLISFNDKSPSTKPFHKILVTVPSYDLDSRIKSEVAFVRQLSKYSIEVIPSTQMIGATRIYTSEELQDILSENQIDGLLLIRSMNSDSKQPALPDLSINGSKAILSADTVYDSRSAPRTAEFQAFVPRLHYEIRLYDVKTAESVWVATSMTKGNVYTQFDQMMTSLANTTVARLRKDGYLN